MKFTKLSLPLADKKRPTGQKESGKITKDVAVYSGHMGEHWSAEAAH